MTKLYLTLILLNSMVLTFAQPPASEIYLFDLRVKADKIILENPQNITNHKGYDNQPFFHPQKSVIYYVSANEEGRTDIVEYNYNKRKRKFLTQTHDREYSPTVTQDKKFLSCILQRDSGAQDLVKYPIDGGSPVVLISNLTVGYHAWADEENVLIFALPQPFTLHLVNVKSKEDSVIAENIHRSLHKIPGKRAVSFLQRNLNNEWVINSFDAGNLKTSFIAGSLSGKEHDMAWMRQGLILMSDEKKLFSLEPGKSNVWQEVEIKSAMPLNIITRLAINSKGNKIALVVAE